MRRVVGFVLASTVVSQVCCLADSPCRIARTGSSVELRSPHFVLRADMATGLNAQSWLNRRTGHTISLGGGPEVRLEVGEPDRPQPLRLRVAKPPEASEGDSGRAVFELAADRPRVTAIVTYEWNAREPVLRKSVEVSNGGSDELRLLHVWLADYKTDAKVAAKEQGFPAYLNDEYFLTLAHPAGWAQGQGAGVSLRQHPGVKLAPGAKFRSMEAVYGVGQAGAARQVFLSHVRSRMRRVVRGHDKPYAIFEPFGARPGGSFDETEEFVLDNIAKLAQSQRETGCRWDAYSTEAIQNAVIEFLHAMDAECPDVFLILYWGHRSPWWLLHADTLFDSGIGIEAASPSDFPAPFARDSITQKLDQAQWHASDVPALGKDSLGVWLSDWGWNSSVGKERWQEGFVMDLSRGSLLAQPWSDFPWLSPPERKQMADFVALLRAQPGCFGNSRFILGNPWKEEPYGYCLTDGKRAFLALNNCTWRDAILPLELNGAWGLPDGRAWQLYRWYPDPARLRGDRDTFGAKAPIALRPFEVVLLEAVPAGEAPSLGRTLATKPIPAAFAEPSRAVAVSVEEERSEPKPQPDPLWKVLQPSTLRSVGEATLSVQKDGSILAAGANPACDTYTMVAETDLAAITGIRLEALPDASLPGRGPGRAVNGNFMLNEFRVEAGPRSNDGANAAAPVVLRNPKADFWQDSHGGWPIAAAIDGNPATGWSIDPAEGLPHVAVFETQKPIGFPGGARLTFTMRHGEREHNLGRWRLAVTSAKPPFQLPKGYGPKATVVRGTAPATAAGGLLVVTAEMRRAGAPMPVHNVGSHFTVRGTLAGQDAAWTPVLGKATYPAPWQAWRIALPPGNGTKPFELDITTTLSANTEWKYKAYFVPK